MSSSLVIYYELYGPIYNAPSKNYPFESYMMDQLPPWPIKKACSHFVNIPSNNTLKSGISSRNKALLKALNEFLNLYTNHTGEKNCHKPNNQVMH